MKHTLPLRFRILHYASQVQSFTAEDLQRDLLDEYRGERQFTLKMLSWHCGTLRASGLIDEIMPGTYSVNEYGLRRLRYLPDEWKEN